MRQQHTDIWEAVTNPAPLYVDDVPRCDALDIVLQNTCRAMANTFGRHARKWLPGGSLVFDREKHKNLAGDNDVSESGFSGLSHIDAPGGKAMRAHNKAAAAHFRFMRSGYSKLISWDDMKVASKEWRMECKSIPTAWVESQGRGFELKKAAALKLEKKEKKKEGGGGGEKKKATRKRRRSGDGDEGGDADEEVMSWGDAIEELVEVGDGKYRWGG